MERHCASINIGPTIKDQVLCQLSDSDRILHPDDLRPKEGFTYRDTEVKNSTEVQLKEDPCYSFQCTVACFNFRSFISFDVLCLLVCLFINYKTGWLLV